MLSWLKGNPLIHCSLWRVELDNLALQTLHHDKIPRVFFFYFWVTYLSDSSRAGSQVPPPHSHWLCELPCSFAGRPPADSVYFGSSPLFFPFWKGRHRGRVGSICPGRPSALGLRPEKKERGKEEMRRVQCSSIGGISSRWAEEWGRIFVDWLHLLGSKPPSFECTTCLGFVATGLWTPRKMRPHANWVVTLGLAKQLCLFCAGAKVMLRINCPPWWLQETQSRRKITSQPHFTLMCKK